MDDIERRLAGALKARADEVTDDSLRDLQLDAPTAPRHRRWPVVATVAALAAALVIGLALIPGMFRARPPAELTPATPCGSPCHLIHRSLVGGDTLEVWMGARPDEWEVRVGGVPVAGFQQDGHYLVQANPLTCWTEPAPARCVVRTTGTRSLGIWISLVKSVEGWHMAGTMYTMATVDGLSVQNMGDVLGVALEFTETRNNQWTKEVWLWSGDLLGCTPFVDAKEKLPVVARPEDLLTKCWT